EWDVVVQTHVAESKAQATLGLQKYGKSLVAHLQRLGVLGHRFSAAHGIWLDADDIARLADAGAVVVHTPISNLRLGAGAAPPRVLLAPGVRLGIGTEASNTPDGQNMSEPQRLGALLSRIADVAPERWLSVEEAFRAATEGSAAILGFDRIGRLEPDYRADIV